MTEIKGLTERKILEGNKLMLRLDGLTSTECTDWIIQCTEYHNNFQELMKITKKLLEIKNSDKKLSSKILKLKSLRLQHIIDINYLYKKCVEILKLYYNEK